MRRATLGTHVARTPDPLSKRREVPNPRRTRKVERGEIRQVLPNTTTLESRRDYANRMSQQAFIERSVASSRRRKIIAAVAFALVALTVAGIAASFVFVNSIDARLQIEDASLTSVLADASADGAVYTLLAASFDDQDGGAGPDVALLVRTDAANSAVSIIVIPGDTRVTLSDDQYHRLGEATSHGGDASVVTAVEDLTDIQISHYVKIDSDGFAKLVDLLEGVEVTLSETVLDPDAGSTKLPKGTQTLTGEQALFLCRANDYASDAEEQRALNQALVAKGFFQRLATMDKATFYKNMDDIADCLQTDLSTKDAYALLSSLKGVDASAITAGTVPTYASESDGTTSLVPVSDEWASMLERFTAGQDPYQDKQAVIDSVDSASFTITVNNGGSIEGAAADASSILTNAGFNVTSVGNAAQAVYDTTLVIYQSSDNESKAEALVATLGTGRAVLDAVNYSFETDILVVVGKDWQDVIDAREKAAYNAVTSGSSAS